MDTTLLMLGIACIITAIVGGGLEAVGFKFPVVNSKPRQIILAVLGLILILVSRTFQPKPPPEPEPTALPTSPPIVPDLVLTDIILKPAPDANEGFVIINTVVSNQGATTQQGFIVGCTVLCNDSIMYFSGMRMSNGLGSKEEATLGGNSELYLGDCAFQAQREFTCTVDSDNLVNESDESNNTLKEILLTGR